MPVPIAVGAGIAIRGVGKALIKSKVGQKVLKNVIKRIKKTPNKKFTDSPAKSGGKQKEKAIKQQRQIKRNYDAKGDTYTSPFKKGGKV
jgi:hypothetical protein